MFGRSIADPDGVESDERLAEGLGLLGFHTVFGADKRTTQVEFRCERRAWLCDEPGETLRGYEIHMGRLRRERPDAAAFTIMTRNGAYEQDLDGAVSADGAVIGTMVHGLFDNASVRRALVQHLRRRRGLSPRPPSSSSASGAELVEVDEYDRLADTVRANVNVPALLALIGR
jgi:adenosylcobyric acid synthase